MQGGKTGALDTPRNTTHTHAHAKNHLDVMPRRCHTWHPAPPTRPVGWCLLESEQAWQAGAKERVRPAARTPTAGARRCCLGIPDHCASDRELLGALPWSWRSTCGTLWRICKWPPSRLIWPRPAVIRSPRYVPVSFKHLMGTSRNTNVLPRVVPLCPLRPCAGSAHLLQASCNDVPLLYSRTTCRGHLVRVR